MDTKLIQQYGTEILSYRLRTVRQKKRMQYEDFDKQLLKTSRRQSELYEQKRNLGWEPLVPPVQKGWIRFFVLRDDVARSKHAELFEKILAKINTCDWSHRKDFLVKYRRYGTKKYRVKKQSLLRPYECQFKQLAFTDEEKQFFYEVWETDCKKRLVKRYVFSEPWRFVLRTRPNIIDKVKKRDALIDAELQGIWNYLRRNRFCRRLDKLLNGGGGCWWKDYEDGREKNMLKNKSLQQILDELTEDRV
ncbi:hypothetical protein [Niastella vici]|nr:hypothetical protein [Niastella vici]